MGTARSEDIGLRAPVTSGRARWAWWGVIALFLVHGLVVSTWISRIPAVQIALHLSNGVLGLTLLSAAAGAVTVIPLAGYFTSRYGSKIVTSVSSAVFCLTVILPGLATDAWTLAFGLFVYGAAAAAMDVSMNAQGVEVEKQLGSPTMSRFHAMFSGGAMIGAAVGGSIAAASIRPLPHFVGSAVINLAAVLLVTPWLIADQPHPEGVETPHRLPLRAIPPVLLALSAIAFCILLSEGAMADWTAVYLRQILWTGQGIAAMGYSVFSAAMALFRFVGDFITARLGPLRTVRWGCVVAALGLIWTLSSPTAGWAMPGLAAAGAGLSVVIPLIFGSGGRVRGVSPGAGIATVTGIGYVGFIVGPPTIGFASQIVTLRLALSLVVLCCLTAAWLAGYMRLVGSPVTSAEQSVSYPS